MEPREGTGCWYSYMRYAATNGAQTLVPIRHEKQMPIIISPFKDGPTLHGLTHRNVLSMASAISNLPITVPPCASRDISTCINRSNRMG